MSIAIRSIEMRPRDGASGLPATMNSGSPRGAVNWRLAARKISVGIAGRDDRDPGSGGRAVQVPP